MKAILCILSLGVTSALLADDINTLRGKTYKNATVTRVEPNGISVSHDDSLAKILFTDIPEDLRTRYGFDQKKAAAYSQIEQAAAAQRATAERAAMAAEEASKKQVTSNVRFEKPPRGGTGEPGIHVLRVAGKCYLLGWVDAKMPCVGRRIRAGLGQQESPAAGCC